MLKYFCRTENEESSMPCDLKPMVTKSGRKIKGRGTMVGYLSTVDAPLWFYQLIHQRGLV